MFERRLEEGYDVYDCHYVAWPKINHPEALPVNVSESAFNDTLVSDQFQNISPLDPVQVTSSPSSSAQ